MEGTEVRKLAALEDKHWWYAERRHLLAQMLKGRTPGKALDIGAAGGGNTRVLRALGWQASPLEYGPEGAEVCRDRGLPVMRADATLLPLADASLDLVSAFDVLEHLEDDDACVREVRRVLRPDGTLWLELGDSYDSGTTAGRRASATSTHGNWERGGTMGDRRVTDDASKPKDLMGAPFLVSRYSGSAHRLPVTSIMFSFIGLPFRPGPSGP